MLASVTERVGEIGLRCAVGAGPDDIRRQFALETAVTIVLGGIGGIALGAALVAFATSRMPIQAPFSWGAVSIGLAAATVTGLVAGVFPRDVRRDSTRSMRCGEAAPRTFGTSLRALFAHRVRAMLAVLTVSVGTAAVIVTNAIGTGADPDIQRGIDSLGVNLVMVGRRRSSARWRGARAERRGEIADARRLRGDRRSAGTRRRGAGRRWCGHGRAERRAVPHQFARHHLACVSVRAPSAMRSGRFFDDEDDRAARRVVVLGARVADQLADPETSVVAAGSHSRHPLRRIGVLAPKGRARRRR